MSMLETHSNTHAHKHRQHMHLQYTDCSDYNVIHAYDVYACSRRISEFLSTHNIRINEICFIYRLECVCDDICMLYDACLLVNRLASYDGLNALQANVCSHRPIQFIRINIYIKIQLNEIANLSQKTSY